LIDRFTLNYVHMVFMHSLYYTILTYIVGFCRWRPETHSFHLPCGEMTVTLQGVAMFFGLGIRGRPVIGSAVFEGWHGRVEEFLGTPPPTPQGEEARRGRVLGVSLHWLTRGLLSAQWMLTRGQSRTTAERGSSTPLVLFFSQTPQETVLHGLHPLPVGLGRCRFVYVRPILMSYCIVVCYDS
jgi:hypothetical protein